VYDGSYPYQQAAYVPGAQANGGGDARDFPYFNFPFVDKTLQVNMLVLSILKDLLLKLSLSDRAKPNRKCGMPLKKVARA